MYLYIEETQYVGVQNKRIKKFQIYAKKLLTTL